MANAWGYTGATPATGSAGTASGTVLAANAQRKYLYIANLGNQVVSLNFGGAAIANQGIVLSGRGTPECSYEMCVGKGNIYTGVVLGITSAGSTDLAILEGV